MSTTPTKYCLSKWEYWATGGSKEGGTMVVRNYVRCCMSCCDGLV